MIVMRIAASYSAVLKRISAWTRSRWKASGIRIEVYSGAFLSASREPFYRRAWDGSSPLALEVKASARRPYKADRTVMRFRMPGAAFGAAIEDLLSHDGVYVPHANVLVTRDPPPVAPGKYLKRISARKSMLEEVRGRRDQDFHHALAAIHNKAQDVRGWAPMLISLACDNRKFLVHRDGSIVFNEYGSPDDFPGESDGIHAVAANVGQWRFAPGFGGGRALPVERHLAGGWLPVPLTTVKDQNITYRQMTCIAPVGEAPAGKPAWRRERALGVVEYLVKDGGTEPADVRLSLRFAPQQDPQRSIQYREGSDGILAASGDRILAFIDRRKAAPLSWGIEPAGVVLSGRLPAGAEKACTVYLPARKVAPDDLAALMEDAPWAPRVESYWRGLLEAALQIEIPDTLLANTIRASQVNCLLAARNKDRSELVVPWISSIHFAYPESEANSILRDDVKPFIRSYFNAIPALVNLEVLTFWEDMLGGRCAAGAWNKTHETGWFLGQTRTLCVTERGDELWLAPFVTNRWLQDGQEVSVRNAPTRFGKVDYTIRSRVAEGRIEAVVRLPGKCTAGKVGLRLRHPDGKPMRSVAVRGKAHADFGPRREIVVFIPDDDTIAVEARY